MKVTVVIMTVMVTVMTMVGWNHGDGGGIMMMTMKTWTDTTSWTDSTTT